MQSKAFIIATALYSKDPDGTELPIADMEDNLYHAVDVVGFGSDEMKADLYARLAEKLTADTKFTDAVDIIATCMQATLTASWWKGVRRA